MTENHALSTLKSDLMHSHDHHEKIFFFHSMMHACNRVEWKFCKFELKELFNFIIISKYGIDLSSIQMRLIH